MKFLRNIRKLIMIYGVTLKYPMVFQKGKPMMKLKKELKTF
ncbi:Uncharacterised protein [Roseburia hominis]|nr:Uncharacterised protein [Roseburia hominis]